MFKLRQKERIKSKYLQMIEDFVSYKTNRLNNLAAIAPMGLISAQEATRIVKRFQIDIFTGTKATLSE